MKKKNFVRLQLHTQETEKRLTFQRLILVTKQKYKYRILLLVSNFQGIGNSAQNQTDADESISFA